METKQRGSVPTFCTTMVFLIAFRRKHIINSLFNSISVDEIEQVLKEYQDPCIRQLACYEVNSSGYDRDNRMKASRILKGVASDPKEEKATRHVAIMRLGNSRYDEVDALVDIALQDTDPTLRAQACLSLGSHVDNPIALECLIAIIVNRSEEIIVRQHACAELQDNHYNLNHTNPDKYVPPLLEALRSDCATIKLSVIDILLTIVCFSPVTSSVKEKILQTMISECSQDENEGVHLSGFRISVKDYLTKEIKDRDFYGK